MNHETEFDNILDAALREYREAEPLAGIEDRALRRVRGDAARQPTVGLQWRIIAATLVALVALAWIGGHRVYEHRPSPPHLARKAPPILASPQLGAILRRETPGTPERLARHAARVEAQSPAVLALTRPEPKRDQFPTPVPLDRDERALLALAQSEPEALRPFIQDDDSTADIVPITIQPLEHSEIEGED